MRKLVCVCILATLFFQNILVSQTLDATLLEINFGLDSEPDNFTIVGENLYFTANDGTYGRELWITDGSYNGTRMVKNIREFSSSAFTNFNTDKFTSIGDILYFRAQDDEHGKELWRTDGTESGTYMVKDVNASNSASSDQVTMITLNNKIIYNFNTYEYGEELWVSDGTEVGTHLLKDINVGSNSSNPQSMFLFNNLVYFVAKGGQLWKTDGTEAGTQMAVNLNDIGIGPQDFLVMNGKIYFSAIMSGQGRELWSSDGTTEGTQLVKDIRPGYGSSLNNLEGSVLGDIILFKADDGVHGNELWRTDGTTSGTYMVKNINGEFWGSLDYETSFVTFGNSVYFTANDEIHGSEVWKSDGTANGTIMLKDISSDINAMEPTKLYATSNYLYFLIRDPQGFGRNLWVSDGTEAGTQELLNEDVGKFSMIELNNKAFFSASTPLNGNELWETNGNPNNTKLFKDINASLSADVAAPRFINDKLIFYARNSVVGREPFISDGTIDGTRLIADINPGDSDSNNDEYYAMDFAKAGNNVVFFAKSDIGGIELYKSDLDGNNASLLKNINGSNNSSMNPSSFLISFNNEAYFTADDGIHGSELWKTDGTENGTVMVKDITPNGGTSLLKPFIFKNHLYIENLSGNSVYLRRTDGTEAGTQIVTSMPYIKILATSEDYIYFASSNEYPVINQTNKIWRIDENNNEELIEEWPLGEDIKLGAVFNNNLYFAASDNSSGYQAIYKTNGTPNAAERVFYGTNYNIFLDMAVCGDYLYATRGLSDGNHFIKEIWRTDGTPEGSEIIISETNHPTFGTATSFACLQNSKFVFNDYDSQGIYSISENEANAEFHPVNVLNDNFEINHVSDIYANGNQIMFYAQAPGHGYELYSAEASSILSISNPHTAFDNSQQSMFKVYPNPTKNFVTIENILNHPIEKLEIYDITGQKLGEVENDSSNPKTISTTLENLSSGIYLIKVYSNNNTETLKVIKD